MSRTLDKVWQCYIIADCQSHITLLIYPSWDCQGDSYQSIGRSHPEGVPEYSDQSNYPWKHSWFGCSHTQQNSTPNDWNTFLLSVQNQNGLNTCLPGEHIVFHHNIWGVKYEWFKAMYHIFQTQSDFPWLANQFSLIGHNVMRVERVWQSSRPTYPHCSLSDLLSRVKFPSS